MNFKDKFRMENFPLGKSMLFALILQKFIICLLLALNGVSLELTFAKRGLLAPSRAARTQPACRAAHHKPPPPLLICGAAPRAGCVRAAR